MDFEAAKMRGESLVAIRELHECLKTVVIFTVIGCLLVDIYLYDARPWTLYITRVTRFVLISVLFIDCMMCALLGKPVGVSMWIVLSAAILAHVFHRKIPRLRAINSTLETVTLFLCWLMLCFGLTLHEQFLKSDFNVYRALLLMIQVVFLLVAIGILLRVVTFQRAVLSLALCCCVYYIDVNCELYKLPRISLIYLLLLPFIYSFFTQKNVLIAVHALSLYCLSPSQVMVFPDVSIDIRDFPILYRLLDFIVCCLVAHIPIYGEYLRHNTRYRKGMVLFTLILTVVTVYWPYIMNTKSWMIIPHIHKICLTEVTAELSNVQHISETHSSLSKLTHQIIPPSSTLSQEMDSFIQAVVEYKLALPKRWEDYVVHLFDYVRSYMISSLGTGSWCEGFPWEVCNDVDWMDLGVNRPSVLFEHPQNRRDYEQCGYLLATEVSNTPVYLRLKAPPGVDYRDDVTKAALVDWPGRHQTGTRRLDSGKFTACSVTDGSSIFIRGPALTSLLYPLNPSLGMEDRVLCLVCGQWPVKTNSFFHRHRPYGWPFRHLLNKIKASGCHVVPVGHPNSPYKTSEWRLSFSLAEKELILAVSDVKFGCMYLLKATKKRYWKGHDTELRQTPTLFCSYYIKTACLWVWEMTPEDVNTLELCRAVLDWLISCYHDNKLPHYFVPEQNLLDHINKYQCKEVSDWLIQIRSNLHTICLCSLSGDIRMQMVKETMGRALELSPDHGWDRIISESCSLERGEQIIQDGTKLITCDWIRKRPKRNNNNMFTIVCDYPCHALVILYVLFLNIVLFFNMKV